MSDRAFDPDRIFAVLCAHRVQFIVIGGLAAAVHGVSWATYDADVLVETSEANLTVLQRALDELSAEYNTPHQPPIRPDLHRLASLSGPQLFRTRYGRLDVLKEAGGETYATVLSDAAEVTRAGVSLRCASVAALLRMKRAANRPKDQTAIRMLRGKLGSSGDDE